MSPRSIAQVAWAAVLAVAAGAGTAAPGGELVLRLDHRSAGRAGPLADAQALQPGIAPPTPSSAGVELELRHTQPLGAGWTLHGNVRGAQVQPEGGSSHDASRVNEAHLAWDGGAWQLGIGRQVMSWDVGYGFRPNDLVQQEERRTLLAQTPQGRAVVRVEHFGAETAWSLVAVRPQAWNRPADEQRGADESALALRAYRRIGGLDLHGYARQGRHTGPSVGLAAAWVPGDALELHASWRVMRHHDGWALAADAPLPASTVPWQRARVGGASQWLVGLQWTGGPSITLLAEWWHDGQAPSDDTWQRWQSRNVALVASPAPVAAVAGNLAWQGMPLAGPGLRRDNAYLRASWQDGEWTLAGDALLHPADRGRALGASLQWRGAQWRVDAAVRAWGGPSTSVGAQLPLRRQWVLSLSRAFG